MLTLSNSCNSRNFPSKRHSAGSETAPFPFSLQTFTSQAHTITISKSMDLISILIKIRCFHYGILGLAHIALASSRELVSLPLRYLYISL